MIVQQIERTKIAVQLYEEFLQNKRLMQNVEDTFYELKKANSTLAKVGRQTSIIREVLKEEDAVRITDKAAKIKVDLQESKAAFKRDRRRVQEIRAIDEDLIELMQDLRSYWVQHATNEIHPHRELYSLVQDLPRIREERLAFTQLFSSLEAQADTFPDSPAKFESFKKKIEELRERLDEMSGLSPAILRFLERVRQGRYTLADLDEEVLAWCKEDNRGRAFKVTL